MTVYQENKINSTPSKIIDRSLFKKGETRGYAMVPVQVTENHKVTHIAFRIWVEILTKPDTKVWTVEGLGKALHMDRGAVSRALNNLQDNGLLTWKKWKERGQWRSEITALCTESSVVTQSHAVESHTVEDPMVHGAQSRAVESPRSTKTRKDKTTFKDNSTEKKISSSLREDSFFDLAADAAETRASEEIFSENSNPEVSAIVEIVDRDQGTSSETSLGSASVPDAEDAPGLLPSVKKPSLSVMESDGQPSVPKTNDSWANMILGSLASSVNKFSKSIDEPSAVVRDIGTAPSASNAGPRVDLGRNKDRQNLEERMLKRRLRYQDPQSNQDIMFKHELDAS